MERIIAKNGFKYIYNGFDYYEDKSHGNPSDVYYRCSKRTVQGIQCYGVLRKITAADGVIQLILHREHNGHRSDPFLSEKAAFERNLKVEVESSMEEFLTIFNRIKNRCLNY